jgi:AGCS family alanine or glycine:cation symporter
MGILGFILRRLFDMSFSGIVGMVDGWVWGTPLIVLILATGLLLTVRTGLVQVVHLPKALKYMFKNEQDGEGEVSSFGALCTALSATIGTGNIVGVATAISVGGPGALFWMWLAAFLGMATKYAEGLLAIKYRTIDENGHVLGGPFYYIERGMGSGWKWMAKLFALFGAGAGLLGIGTVTQINGIAGAVERLFDPNQANIAFSIGENSYTWATTVTAVLAALFVGLVIIGGIKRIASVAEKVVPFMAVFYIVVCVVILLTHLTAIPAAFGAIFKGAFSGTAAVGGFAGAAMKVALQKGVARGIFSNEAGLGSAPIAAAAASTKSCVRQGLVSMTGVFIDTILICTMTGLTLILTDAWCQEGIAGVGITSYAFSKGMYFAPFIGQLCVTLSLAFFAFTTILGWDYYAERCVEYLVNGNMKVVQVYRYLWILAVLVGPFLALDVVWDIADILNGLMAFPNLVALVALSGVVARESKEFHANLKKQKN